MAHKTKAIEYLLPTTLLPGERISATSFFIALGVDPHFSGLRTISEKLQPLLADDTSLQPSISTLWKQIRQINAKILASPTTRSSAIPPAGASTLYPIWYCLKTDPFSRDQAAAITSLKRLLVCACILRSRAVPGDNCVDRAATEIRLACDPHGERRKTSIELPSGPLGLQYLVALRNRADSLRHPLASTDRSYVFLVAILRLTDYVLQFRRFPCTLALRPPSALEHSLAELGTIQASEADPAQAARGDAESLRQLAEASTERGNEHSQDGFKAAGLCTLYWLSQVESGVIWQRNAISPYELPRLRNLLSTLPALSQSSELGAARALIVALVSATGLDPEEILTMSIGQKGDFTWSGQYHRRIPRPENAFERPQETGAARLYQGTPATAVTLDLPSTVQIMLQTLRPNVPAGAGTLAKALGFDIGTPERLRKVSTECREACGNLLRAHVSVRLRYPHLRLALRQAVYQESRDPVLSYLIAAHPNLAPPTQMYYAAIPVARVLEVHRRVMQQLFGPL